MQLFVDSVLLSGWLAKFAALRPFFDYLQRYFVKFSEKQRRLVIDTLQISVVSVIRFSGFNSLV